jgi:hypothetical protein
MKRGVEFQPAAAARLSRASDIFTRCDLAKTKFIGAWREMRGRVLFLSQSGRGHPLPVAVASFEKRIEKTCRLRARNAPAQLSR